jgi:2-amino-4-hydroxy-6-hydroxymethyldihydropteridine diphosphokinase
MRGYLGLGSNVGDRLEHMRRALHELAHRGVEVIACSSVYETEPVGLVTDQREFLNACLRIETALSPEELLGACKSVEQTIGRTPGGPRHGPREIDVDLLLLDSVTYSSAKLTLPHPSVTERRFVLVPLLELDPELKLPDGTRLSDALDGLGSDQRVKRAGPPLS